MADYLAIQTNRYVAMAIRNTYSEACGMEKNFNIIVDLNMLEKSDSNQITAGIYFQYGENYFPKKGWNDVVLIILNQWIDAMRQIINERNDIVKLEFMDGNFSVKAKYSAPNLMLEFMGGHESDDKCVLSLQQFIHKLTEAALKVIMACKKQKWDTPELTKLSHNYHSILDRSRRFFNGIDIIQEFIEIVVEPSHDYDGGRSDAAMDIAEYKDIRVFDALLSFCKNPDELAVDEHVVDCAGESLGELINARTECAKDDPFYLEFDPMILNDLHERALLDLIPVMKDELKQEVYRYAKNGLFPSEATNKFIKLHTEVST